MFFRTKKSGARSYLQVVENRWENGRSRQRVVATLGRLDQLQESGQLHALLASVYVDTASPAVSALLAVLRLSFGLSFGNHGSRCARDRSDRGIGRHFS
jgi:hypothetical protein